MTTARTWRVSDDRLISLDEPRLMGVVNTTPDSFSDGGVYRSVDALVGHGLRLIEEGATILDVGGESTRPGATRIDAAEQISRAIPVVAELSELTEVTISIDTTLAPVAEAALDAGARIINDVSAGREDPEILALAAERGCGLVLMHRLRPPDADVYSDQYDRTPRYDDVVETVRAFLLDRCEIAEAAGAAKESIIVDPGLGFGKTVSQNFELIRRTGEFVATGYPVLSAASRKSFIGAVTGVELARDRVIGSTAVSVIHALAGVRLFRVHDVAAHREALAVTSAAERGSHRKTAARTPVG